MAEYSDREHYIPLRKRDLIDFLAKDSRLDRQHREAFRQFCRLVSAVWHFEYYETLERIKDAYAPFDPDATIPPLQEITPEQRHEQIDRLFTQIALLVEKANYIRLSRKDIEAAVEGGASDWGVNMHVDWSVFERLEMYVRSQGKTLRIKRHPLFFWRTEEKAVETYRRLLLVVKLRKHRRLPPTIDTEDVFLKMFKDIPKLDIEMVLPGTSLQMPLTQKWKLGGSLIGSFGYAIWSLWTGLVKAITALVAGAMTLTFGAVQFALFAPFLALFGYGYKQYYSYMVTKQTYAKMLAESLYYQNLDNNLGVVTQILDEAEEQECRETILAYFYLWKYAPSEGWSSDQLDDYIEMDLEGKLNLKVDFEIQDALDKLLRLNLVTLSGDKYRTVPIDRALELLDHRWDNYFIYNKEGPVS